MTKHFTSDLHFWHLNVISYCNRPFKTVEEMNEALIANWNAVVRDDDIVFVMGDFSMGSRDQMKSIVPRLKGRKRLISGNHDRDAKTMLEAGFESVEENTMIKLSDGKKSYKVLASHFPYHPVLTYNRSSDVTEDGKVWNMQLEGNIDGRYLHKRILDDGKHWLLHGHVHQHWKVRGRMINVGVDVWDMKPVTEKQLIDIMNGVV